MIQLKKISLKHQINIFDIFDVLMIFFSVVSFETSIKNIRISISNDFKV